MEAVPKKMHQSLTTTIKIRKLQRRRHATMSIDCVSIVVVSKHSSTMSCDLSEYDRAELTETVRFLRQLHVSTANTRFHY